VTELSFALAASCVLFGVAVPLTTVATKLLLSWRRRRTPEITSYGSTRGYLYVTAPVLLPCVWMLSAALHQSEPGGALGACRDEQLLGSVCGGALSLALALITIVLVAAMRVPGGTARVLQVSEASRRGQARVDLLRSDANLCRWTGPIGVVDGSGPAACVRGLFRPRIELSANYVARLDSDMLRAVLLHEVEHALCGDPLRGFVAEVAMRLNPLGSFLRPEFERWRLAREIACDRHAALLGADRAALADALVRGARFRSGSAVAPGVHSSQSGALELRVRLLLDDSELPCACGSRGGVLRGLLLLLAVALLPHGLGSEPLDSFHFAVDETAADLLG